MCIFKLFHFKERVRQRETERKNETGREREKQIQSDEVLDGDDIKRQFYRDKVNNLEVKIKTDWKWIQRYSDIMKKEERQR